MGFTLLPPICILFNNDSKNCPSFPQLRPCVRWWHHCLSSVTSPPDLWCHVEQCDWYNLTTHVTMPGMPPGKLRRERSQRKGQFWLGKEAKSAPTTSRKMKEKLGFPCTSPLPKVLNKQNKKRMMAFSGTNSLLLGLQFMPTLQHWDKWKKLQILDSSSGLGPREGGVWGEERPQ